MIETAERHLNCNEELRKNISTFIEAFVKYYGEDKRKIIEEKFSKVTYIGYQTASGIRSNLSKIEKEKTNELINELLKENSLNLEIKDLYGTFPNIENDYLPIYRIKEYIETSTKSLEKLYQEQLEEGYNYITSYFPTITQEEFLEIGQNKNIPERLKNLPKIFLNNIEYYCDIDTVKNNKKRNYEKLKELLEKIFPEITQENFENYIKTDKMQELIKLSESALLVKDEFKLFKSRYEIYYQELEEYNKAEEQLKNTLHKKFIKENLHFISLDNNELINESDKKEFEEYLSTDKTYFYNKYLKSIFNTTLNMELDIEYFSEEYNEILNNSENDWKKNTIKEKRISYFKTLGIDLGDDYDSYINDEEIIKKWPNQEMVETLSKSRKNYLNQLKIEKLNYLKSYKKLREEINEKDLLLKDDEFNAYAYERQQTYIAPNIKKNNGTYDEHSLFVINFDNYTECKDHYIVHELNHIFELYISGIEGNELKCICGWDNTSSKINDDIEQNVLEDRDIRKYELFNEIMNEIIAQEISKLMHEENLHVFNTKEDAQYKHATSYEHTLFLVKEFYQEFKNEILESRINGKINIIYDTVGKENFDELNNLFTIYNENFSGPFTIYQVIGDIKDGKETNKTKLYFELMDKQHEIVEKMKIYKEINKKEEYTI